MNTVVGFYIYAAIFRLAIIAAGIVSIVLGYKLFVLGVMGGEKTRINAQAGPIKLTLANAGPGLGFSLFGVLIIAVMLVQGNPEFEEYKKLVTVSRPNVEAGQQSDESQPKTISQPETRETYRIRTRSGSGDEDVSTDQEWDKLDKPNITLSEAAEPFSKIARIWLQEQRTGEAVSMARLAERYGSEKNKLDYLALLGETLFENGEYQEAVNIMKTVADRDPLYSADLARMQERLRNKKDYCMSLGNSIYNNKCKRHFMMMNKKKEKELIEDK